MKLLIPILVVLSGPLFGQDQLRPQQSDHPFYQGLHLIYKRNFNQAKIYFSSASDLYSKSNKTDSLALTHLYLSRMHTILLELDSAQIQLDLAHQNMQRLKDTSSFIVAYEAHVEAGLALMNFDIPKAEKLCKSAIETIGKQLGDCNLIMINTLNDYAIVHHVKRQFKLGDSLVSKSLKCGQGLFGENDMRIMAAHNMIGAFSDDRGYSRKAVRHYRAALAIMEDNGLKDTYDYARILNNLANALYDEGGALNAIEILQQSIAITEHSDDYKNNLINAYYNIANMFYSIGYRNKAMEYLNKAENAVSNEARWSTPNFYYLYQLRSRIHALMGQQEASDEDDKLAYEIINKNYGEGSEVLADYMVSQATNLSTQKRCTEAMSVIQNALDGFEKYQWDPIESHRGEFYYIAADCSIELNDTLASINYYKKAINEYASAPPRVKMEIAYPYGAIADIFYQKGQLDSARFYIGRAIQEILPSGEQYDLLKSVPYNTYHHFHQFRFLLSTKINIQMAIFRTTKEKKYLETALQETKVLEEYLETTTSSYLENDDVIERIKIYWPVYEKIIQLRVEAAKEMNDNQYLVEAIYTAEQTKDVLYKMALREASSVEALGLSSKDAELEEKFKSDIESIESEYHESQLNSDLEVLDSLKKVLFNEKRRYDIFKQSLKESHPKYYQARYGQTSLNWEEIHILLNEKNANLIHYFVGDETFLAFVITKNDISIVELGNPKELDEVLDRALISLRQVGDLKPLSDLYQKVFEPIKPFLTKDNLIIVPDGKLHFIPFEALINDEDDFVVKDYNIFYSHSISPLLTQKSSQPIASALIVAPGFEDDLKTELRKRYPESSLLSFIRQPNALNLAKNAGQILSGDVLTDHKATELNFKNQSHHSDLLLLATHAQVDEAHPLYSKIALLPSEEEEEDGFLHVYEILGMDLDHELALLTACETGLGALDRGQGVASLSFAFRYAGCQNIVMSLWSIDEKQSTDLMEKYLGDLESGSSLSTALTNAKREYLKTQKGDLLHPYYWSGLVLVGVGDDPISNSFMPGLLIGLVLFAFIVLAVKKARPTETNTKKN